MPIVITIDDDHPNYQELSDYVESPDCRSAGFVTIEQHEDGTWSARFAHVTPMPKSSRYNAFSVRIRREKP